MAITTSVVLYDPSDISPEVRTRPRQGRHQMDGCHQGSEPFPRSERVGRTAWRTEHRHHVLGDGMVPCSLRAPLRTYPPKLLSPISLGRR